MLRRLRLATFNLENLDECPPGGAPLEERITVLRPQLLRLDADVLCCQEVNGQHVRDDAAPPSSSDGGSQPRPPRRLAALDRLLDETPYAGFHRAFTIRPGGAGPADAHNLVVLSRYPIAESAQLWHDLVPPPAWRMITAEPPAEAAEPILWDRPILHAALDLGAGRLLHVVDVHLRAPLASVVPGQKEKPFAWRSVRGWAEGFFLASVKRAGQALETRLLVDRLFDADPAALVAVCGDFNCVAGEVPFEIIRGGEDQTGSGALANRSLVAIDRVLPEERQYSVLHAGHKVMLDHLLISRPLLAFYRGAEVHNEGLGDEVIGYAQVHRSPDSYHAPVVVEFAVPD